MNIIVSIHPGCKGFYVERFITHLLSFSSIPLVFHAIMAFVRDGGEYSGYRNSHRSARPQSTPKPADSRQKIKGDKKKSQPSALFVALHPSVITAINNTGHSFTLWSLFLPRHHTCCFPAHPSALPLHEM